MKLSASKIDAFVKNPPPGMAALMVYGPDTGLVHERCMALGKTVVKDLNDPFNVSVLKSDQIVEDPARLADEAAALSMMGGRRLVRVEEARDALAPTLKEYLKNPNLNTLVILEAGELTAKSPLRALCEKADNAAALPCYVDSEQDIARLAAAVLRENSYTIAPDALATFAAFVTGDRMQVRSALEKLMVYMGPIKSIAAPDVWACCGDAGEQSLDNLVFSVGDAKTDAAFRAYAYLAQEGLPSVSLVRALQNHFRRLHQARARHEAGESPDVILKTLSPPVFFKQEQAFRAQMQRWSLPVLQRALQRLTALEAQCKKTGMPDETLCRQALLALSRAAA